MSFVKRLASFLFICLVSFSLVACTGGTNPDKPKEEKTFQELKDSLDLVTVTEALSMPASSKSFYLYGTVKEVKSATFGEMYITDGLNDIFVLSFYSKDGGTSYGNLTEKPDELDEVILKVTLAEHNGTVEVSKAYLIGFNPVKNPEPEMPEPPVHTHSFVNGVCSCGEKDPNYVEPSVDITQISEALAMAKGDTVTIEGTVDGIYYAWDDSYGNMSVYLSDETGRMLAFRITEKVQMGYVIRVTGTIDIYNGTAQIAQGSTVEVIQTEKPIDPNAPVYKTVADARNAEKGSRVELTGVVAQITYAFGMVPDGFFLVDNTGSIYVYGKDVAAEVKVGNTVSITGNKTYYVLDTEMANAEKYGYLGCNQIDSARLVSNDNGTSDFDKSWIEEISVKELLEMPLANDITTKIYKVTAQVVRAEGKGFTNYYFNDLDGVTGSYAYTKCSGGDFTWLDQFDGKICTVYLTAINAKSEPSGCFYRLQPITVIDEGFEFDETKAPSFALDYYALPQFLTLYKADPATELLTSVVNELGLFESVELLYTSSNEDVVYFEEVEGKLVFHTKNAGLAVVTIVASYKNYTESINVEIEVKEAEKYDAITVKEAIESEDNTEVIVKGIVAASTVNQDGFYLVDESGVISCLGPIAEVALLSVGDEVIIKGTKIHRLSADYATSTVGHIVINDCTVLLNNYGNHEIPTDSFDTSMTLEDLSKLDKMEDHTAEAYVITGVIKFIDSKYYTSVVLETADGSISMNIYSSSGNQYSDFSEFFGKEVTLTVCICNWNSKKHQIAILYATDGTTTIYNTLNFEN